MGTNRSALWIFILVLLLCVLITGADAASTAKFEYWFPLLSQRTYRTVSEGVCNATLIDYRQSLTGASDSLKAAMCSHQQACILENLREDLKSRMASASVLLGLTPSLLASIGPSVVETAILSTQNPILSLLISLGCPAVFPARLLQYDDAREALRIPPFQPFGKSEPRSAMTSWIFKILKYVFLCAAAANVFYTSFELGTKTVVSFRCVNYTLVIIWTSLSVPIHLVSACAFHDLFSWSRSNRADGTGYQPTNQVGSFDGSQLQLTLSRHDTDLEERLKPTNRSIILNYVSTSLGFLHVVFGTLIFSSLLFIETMDAVAVILRYMASTVTARIVLMYELDHLKRHQKQKSRGTVEEVEFQSLVPPRKPVPNNNYNFPPMQMDTSTRYGG